MSARHDEINSGRFGAGGDVRVDFVPADRYTSEEEPRLEKKNLWPRVWQIVCREEELSRVGDFVRYDICDQSIIVVRSAPDQIKAFHNVCQHRGRRLIDKPSGSATAFYCKYHGWKWSLDGSILHVNAREDWKGCGEFSDGDLSLQQPLCERWGGWVWINMDPQAVPLRSHLGHAATMLDPFEFSDLRRAWHEVLIAPVNWKVVIEAFNEGYHSGATHGTHLDYFKMHAPCAVHGPHAMFFTGQWDAMPKALREDGSWKQTESLTELLYYQSAELYHSLKAMVMEPMMRAVTQLRKETPPETPPEQVYRRLWDLHRKELESTGAHWPSKLTFEHAAAAGTSWHLFPNTIVLPGADGVLWYRMRPHGDDPDKCIFDIWCLRRYAPGTEPIVKAHLSDGFAAAKGRAPFLEQDFENMSAVNSGMKSMGWRGARTNPVQERTIVNFHQELDRYLRGGALERRP